MERNTASTQKGHHTQQSGYSFFMKPNQVHSLVMLKDIQKTLPLLVDFPVYILIDANNRLQFIQKATKLSFLYFKQVQQAEQYIINSLKGRKICIYAPLNMAAGINTSLCCIEEVKYILYHNIDEDLNYDDYFQILKKIANQDHAKNKQLIFSKLRFIGKDIKYIAEENEDTRDLISIKKKLFNMISLGDDGWNSNILLRTIIAMIRQDTYRKQLMEELYSLFVQVYHNIFVSYETKKILDENMHKQEVQSIIKLYTVANSPFNYITNNLLRSSRNPSELYYCQPYLKDLFNTIKSIYSKQKQIETYKTFQCYRGGSATKEQIQFYQKNVGKVVLNLGFLSSSLSEQIAKNFADNLLFVVKVKEHERDQDLDFGYADISSYSVFSNEAEILFNPLNSFSIEKTVHKIIKGNQGAAGSNRTIKVVHLRYGSLAQFIAKKRDNKKLTAKQQNYVTQGEYLVANLTKRIHDQGDSFLSPTDYLDGGIEYWSQKLKHSNSCYERINLLSNIGHGFRFKGQLQKSLQYYQKYNSGIKALCMLRLQKILGEYYKQWVGILSH